MSKAVRISFEREVREVLLDSILPLRPMSKRITDSKRYQRIATSVGAVGVIEPLVVARAARDGRHMLLDGHLRLHALQEQKIESTLCIISDDDETFTYNKRVNRLATVQEHYMISRAIDRGVPPAMIAKALGIDEKVVLHRRNLLDGIAPGAVELLKDRPINPHVFSILRKMKPLKQTETAELMVAMNNFTATYAKAILAASKQTDLAKPDRPKTVSGLTSEQMARMEREMESLTKDYQALEATFGEDVLQLVLASRYLERLIQNTKIVGYLEARYPEIIFEFRNIVSATSLDPN
ncbi:plasmid partitioning protein RepB C-terminal domain-containing protein [Acetobacter sp. LMG 32666]|uniref:plasmid partitioning protein RepB C-terminal domain-containing protein n=1 Tax=Acetobacter sp. LMG 32666 TaxID=2959295 RepID=UPI0030C7C1CE